MQNNAWMFVINEWISICVKNEKNKKQMSFAHENIFFANENSCSS